MTNRKLGRMDEPDDELLDSFVLGDAAGTVGTPQEFHVATAALVASSVSSLLGHGGSY